MKTQKQTPKGPCRYWVIDDQEFVSKGDLGQLDWANERRIDKHADDIICPRMSPTRSAYYNTPFLEVLGEHKRCVEVPTCDAQAFKAANRSQVAA